MCAGDTIRPPSFLQSLDPLLDSPALEAKKKWPTVEKPCLDTISPSSSPSYPQDLVIPTPGLTQYKNRDLGTNPPLRSPYCPLSSSRDTIYNSRESIWGQKYSTTKPDNGSVQLCCPKTWNRQFELSFTFQTSRPFRVRADFFKIILRLLNLCKVCVKIKSQNVSNHPSNVRSKHKYREVEIPMRNISQRKVHKMRFTKQSKKLKLVSQHLRKEIPKGFKQLFFKKRKYLNNWFWLKDPQNFNKTERVLKNRLKRFRKFIKRLKKRFKGQNMVLLPSDSEDSNCKTGSFESGGGDLDLSHNGSMSTKRSGVPNLTCEHTSKLSASTFASSNRNSHDISYVGRHSGCVGSITKQSQMGEKESFKRTSQDTIKLIDKVLEDRSSLRPDKNDKSRHIRPKDSQQARSLSMEESFPLTGVRKLESNYYNKQLPKEGCPKFINRTKFSLSTDESPMAEKRSAGGPAKNKYYHKPLEREKQAQITTIEPANSIYSNAFKLATENFARPTTLFVKSNVPSIKFSQDSLSNDESSYTKSEGFSLSLDSSKYNKAPATVKDEAPTSDLLKRLDSVLSKIVDQEKKKIERCKRMKSNRSAENLFFFPSQRQVRKKPRKQPKETKGDEMEKESQVEKLPKNTNGGVLSSDIIYRHQRCFTEPKSNRPPIVKSDSKSKLVTMRCYQAPRPKQSRKKTLTIRKSFDDRLSTYNESSDDSSPASDNDFREVTERISSKDSFEEEFSSLSVSSLPATKELRVEVNSQVDDDDTCYGTDQIISDNVGRGETVIKYPLPYKMNARQAERSIDSAYTESREETPDLPADHSFDSFRERSHRNFTPSGTEDDTMDSTSLVKLINDCKKYLLEKIKDSRSYSDKNINQLLAYYSKKWKHIPEREIKIIVTSVRNDLGVRASPKECIEFLSGNTLNSNTKGNSCQDLNRLIPHYIPLRKEVSKEDIIADLTTTLPEYLKVHKWKQRPQSTSSSPEPSSSQYFLRVSSSFFTNRGFQSAVEPELCESPSLSSSSKKTELVKEDKTYQAEEIIDKVQRMAEHEQLKVDEEWIKSMVGEATFREMESIINDIKTKGIQTENEPQDFEKLANEICKQFSITF